MVEKPSAPGQLEGRSGTTCHDAHFSDSSAIATALPGCCCACFASTAAGQALGGSAAGGNHEDDTSRCRRGGGLGSRPWEPHFNLHLLTARNAMVKLASLSALCAAPYARPVCRRVGGGELSRSSLPAAPVSLRTPSAPVCRISPTAPRQCPGSEKVCRAVSREDPDLDAFKNA